MRPNLLLGFTIIVYDIFELNSAWNMLGRVDGETRGFLIELERQYIYKKENYLIVSDDFSIVVKTK